jgi:hypothetical protein
MIYRVMANDGRVMAKSNKRGGKRKGAGRPRSAPLGKTSYFSTRISAETRAWLDAESRRVGQTLSSTVERLLRFAMKGKDSDDRNDSIKALCYVIGLLAERIPGIYFARPEYSWRSNPFMFEAFRAAVSSILDELRPPGEVVAPPPLHPTFKSTFKEQPEQHGLEMARALIFQLQSAAVPDILANIPEEKRPPEWNVYTVSRRGSASELLSEQLYGLADAGRALLPERAIVNDRK